MAKERQSKSTESPTLLQDERYRRFFSVIVTLVALGFFSLNEDVKQVLDNLGLVAHAQWDVQTASAYDEYCPAELDPMTKKADLLPYYYPGQLMVLKFENTPFNTQTAEEVAQMDDWELKKWDRDFNKRIVIVTFFFTDGSASETVEWVQLRGETKTRWVRTETEGDLATDIYLMVKLPVIMTSEFTGCVLPFSDTRLDP